MAQLLSEMLTHQQVDIELGAVIGALADTCSEISSTIRRGGLAGILGEAGSGNIQGEQQKKLDVIANDRLLEMAIKAGVCAVASEEMELPVINPSPRNDYLLLFDPLDGSSNIDVNVSIGTIFSILRMPKAAGRDAAAISQAFLQPGDQQIAAGYVVYGPSTQLVLTVGKGVMGFTLDQGQWHCTAPRMQLPLDSKEFAINASNARHWEAPVRRYVDEMLAGKTGPRQEDFNMRWVGSMVADVHRVLSRGGSFMYPRDAREPKKPGRLRLMYEANPMSFLVEQAGGAATNGHGRILSIQPSQLHERCAVFMGSRHEIDRVTSYHQTPN